MIRVQFEEARRVLEEKTLKHGFSEREARLVSQTMAENSLEGVYSHGLVRFPAMIQGIRDGEVVVGKMPQIMSSFKGMENYDGQRGLGIPNGLFCMDRAVELAKEYGIGCVAIRNTSHWLRAATYGYRACKAGMAAICMTNSLPNMPTWGASDNRLGNNPIVLAFPYKDGDLICDMAMSQFSFGALEVAQLNRRELPVDGGYNLNGEVTRDPFEVEEGNRIMPTGYWKGAAMTFLIDAFVSGMSLGNSTRVIGELGGNRDVSQIYMAFNYKEIAPSPFSDEIIDRSVQYLLSSKMIEGIEQIPFTGTDHIIYTGQLAVEKRKDHLEKGIPVHEDTWNKILSL